MNLYGEEPKMIINLILMKNTHNTQRNQINNVKAIGSINKIKNIPKHTDKVSNCSKRIKTI